MLLLAIGLLIFLGIHSTRIFASNWREEKIAVIGEQKWKNLYSIVSLVSFVFIIYGYSVARSDADILYVPFDWGRHAALALMFFSFCLLPFNVRSSRLRKITHHPFMLAVVLWSIAHLLANGDGASVLMFGSFLIWALFCWRAASKRNASLPPVAPLVQDVVAVCVAIGLWALFLLFAHKWLFGVAPIS